MYKLIMCITALSSLMATGCDNNPVNAQPLQNTVNHLPQNDSHMSRLYFDGHHYIKYTIGGRISCISILHDPDCPCRKESMIKNENSQRDNIVKYENSENN